MDSLRSGSVRPGRVPACRCGTRRGLGPWFGTGPERGLALLLAIAGILGLVLTLVALGSRHYRRLSRHCRDVPAEDAPAVPAAAPDLVAA